MRQLLTESIFELVQMACLIKRSFAVEIPWRMVNVSYLIQGRRLLGKTPTTDRVRLLRQLIFLFAISGLP